MVKVEEPVTFKVPTELSMSPTLKSAVVESEPVPVRVSVPLSVPKGRCFVAAVGNGSAGINYEVPPLTNKSPVKVSRAANTSVPVSVLLKLAPAPLMVPPRRAMEPAPTPLVRPSAWRSRGCW